MNPRLKDFSLVFPTFNARLPCAAGEGLTVNLKSVWVWFENGQPGKRARIMALDLETRLSLLLGEFESVKGNNLGIVASTGGVCGAWQSLRPIVANLIGILNEVGLLFPKVLVAAKALSAMQAILDSLCPGSATLEIAGDITAMDLSRRIDQAVHPQFSVSNESPCAIWTRVRPVVNDAIAVIQALVPVVPILAKVVDTVSTLAKMIDAICGTSEMGVCALSDTVKEAASAMVGWEDDPYLVASGTGTPTVATVVGMDLPNNTQPLLKTQIAAATPDVGQYPPSTPEFLYWNAEASLARGINFWGPILPQGTQWSADATPLNVQLDEGVDFNAFYARDSGLNFFHGIVDRVNPPVAVYSAESPHVVCHELGHAILDALKPELFDAMSAEVAAFHESFGDMSSILSALQIENLRKFVLTQTGGDLNTNSRLSQLARQLGWAIRVQISASAVDPDCLRNASNRFFYRNPSGLPPSAPASSLSSEPHSFSRVFTGAFLDILAGMFTLETAAAPGAPSDSLLAVAKDLGTILIEGIRLATVAPGFYGQVAAGMIQADTSLNKGRYTSVLTSSFVQRGIMDPSMAVSLVRDLQLTKDTKTFGVTGVIGRKQRSLSIAGDNEGYKATGKNAPQLPLTAITTSFGLTVHAHLACEAKRFPMLAATVVAGVQNARSPEDEAQDFIEDLLQTGHISHAGIATQRLSVPAAVMAMSSRPKTQKTHYLVEVDDRIEIRRHHFDCRFGCCGHKN